MPRQPALAAGGGQDARGRINPAGRRSIFTGGAGKGGVSDRYGRVAWVCWLIASATAVAISSASRCCCVISAIPLVEAICLLTMTIGLNPATAPTAAVPGVSRPRSELLRIRNGSPPAVAGSARPTSMPT